MRLWSKETLPHRGCTIPPKDRIGGDMRLHNICIAIIAAMVAIAFADPAVARGHGGGRSGGFHGGGFHGGGFHGAGVRGAGFRSVHGWHGGRGVGFAHRGWSGHGWNGHGWHNHGWHGYGYGGLAIAVGGWPYWGYSYYPPYY